MSTRRVAYPRYNLKHIFKLRNKLADDVLTEFAGFRPVGPQFEELLDKLCDTLHGVRRQVLWDSVHDVAGTLLSIDDVYQLSWRLAGNLARLRAGTAVPPWNAQQEKEWAPAQFVSYAPGESRRGRKGGHFTLRILAGTACPLRVTKFLSRGFAHQIALRLGYSRLRGKSPLGHISELVNLRLWIELDPEYCRPGAPGFNHVGCSAGLKNWNTEIIKKRFRRGWRCPYDYDHYCYVCPVGYQHCPAATHQFTIIEEYKTNVDCVRAEEADNSDVPGAPEPSREV